MRILIVEDDRDMMRFIRKGLSEAGFTVDAATDGEEGLFLCVSQTYDLIVLDIMLPGMNGYDILKQIRQKGIAAPVLFLTARDDKEDVVKGLNLGADDYLIKPFSFTELLARIRALLRRSPNIQAEQQLTVGGLVLDLLTRHAYRDGRLIELTAKEFSILEYLMRHASQLLTRTMIIEHVWGYDFDTQSNVIEVHINRLRNKIDKGFATRLIHTIRSVGYVIKAG